LTSESYSPGQDISTSQRYTCIWLVQHVFLLWILSCSICCNSGTKLWRI